MLALPARGHQVEQLSEHHPQYVRVDGPILVVRQMRRQDVRDAAKFCRAGDPLTPHVVVNRGGTEMCLGSERLRGEIRALQRRAEAFTKGLGAQ